MRVPILALALVAAACGDDAPAPASSTDLLLERSEDLAPPTDAAATTPVADGAPSGAPDSTRLAPVADDTSGAATPVVTAPPPTGETPTGEAPPAGSRRAGTPPAGTPTPTPAPTPQPREGETASAAAAQAMWGAFRSAVSSRNTSAIARLIADPVMVDGQSTSHADFADRVPDGDIGAFVSNFGGSLSPSAALQPATGGGYHGTATATTEDGQEATLLFRVAPSADGSWRVVEITPAD